MICLVDIRIAAQQLDHDMIDFVRSEELPYVVALTKADKLSKGKRAQARETLAQSFGIDKTKMIITSSESGEGMAELRRLIEEQVYSD